MGNGKVKNDLVGKKNPTKQSKKDIKSSGVENPISVIKLPLEVSKKFEDVEELNFRKDFSNIPIRSTELYQDRISYLYIDSVNTFVRRLCNVKFAEFSDALSNLFRLPMSSSHLNFLEGIALYNRPSNNNLSNDDNFISACDPIKITIGKGTIRKCIDGDKEATAFLKDIFTSYCYIGQFEKYLTEMSIEYYDGFEPIIKFDVLENLESASKREDVKNNLPFPNIDKFNNMGRNSEERFESMISNGFSIGLDYIKGIEIELSSEFSLDYMIRGIKNKIKDNDDIESFDYFLKNACSVGKLNCNVKLLFEEYAKNIPFFIYNNPSILILRSTRVPGFMCSDVMIKNNIIKDKLRLKDYDLETYTGSYVCNLLSSLYKYLDTVFKSVNDCRDFYSKYKTYLDNNKDMNFMEMFINEYESYKRLANRICCSLENKFESVFKFTCLPIDHRLVMNDSVLSVENTSKLDNMEFNIKYEDGHSLRIPTLYSEIQNKDALSVIYDYYDGVMSSIARDEVYDDDEDYAYRPIAITKNSLTSASDIKFYITCDGCDNNGNYTYLLRANIHILDVATHTYNELVRGSFVTTCNVASISKVKK